MPLFRKRTSTWQRVANSLARVAGNLGKQSKAGRAAMGMVGGVIGLTAASAAASAMRDGDADRR